MKNYGKQITQELGRFGQGSVNLLDGTLSFESEDFSFGGNRMPITISHSYDGKISDAQFTANNELGIHTADFSAMKLGHGFKLNVMQSMVKNGEDYIFTTEDGEEIVLKPTSEQNKYKSSEEDGELEYDESTRILKNGDDYLFDEMGRLVKITDEKGNTNEFVYEDGKLAKVIDGAGREFNFTYNSSKFLKSIVAPDGTQIAYSYISNKLTRVIYPNGQKAEITYPTQNDNSITVELFENNTTVYKMKYLISNNKVTQITETGFADGAEKEGVVTTITYSNPVGRTVVTTNEPRLSTVYLFDEDGDVYSQYYSQTSTPETPYEDGNNITAVNNLLLGHIFDSTLSGWKKLNVDIEKTTLQVLEDEKVAKFGKSYLKITTTDTDGTCVGLQQEIGTQTDEYTFSAYMRVKSGFENESDGVYLRIYDSEVDVVLAQSEKLRIADSEFVRVSASFHGGNMSFKVQILVDGAGEVEIQAPQFEGNPTANSYNLLSDANESLGLGWNLDNAEYSYDEGFRFFGALAINGDTAKAKNTHQSVAVKTAKETRETFKLSGWAKGTPLSESSEENKPTFRLRAVIYYADHTEETPHIQTETADFSTLTTEWQFASVEFAKKEFAEVSNVEVFCDYDFNQGTAYFDDIELVRTAFETKLTEEDFVIEDEEETTTETEEVTEETEEETEEILDFEELTDAFGNILTETTYTDGEFGTIYRSFGFDEDGNNLLTETDSRGNKTEYEVDGVTSRNKEITDRLGNKTAYEYDDSGRTTKVTSKNADGDEVATVSYTYDSFDSLTEIVRGDGLKYVLQYNAFHNLESIAIDGKSDGKLITYTYKENNGRLKEMTYANGDKMTATYDGKGNMIAEHWYDASGNLTAHYKYGYSAQGEIVLTIDMLAKKMYNYTYENDRLEQSTESDITFFENFYVSTESGLIGSKTLVCSVRYYYDDENTLTKKRIVWADGNEQIISYTTAENESQLVKTEIGEHSFVSTSKTDSFGRKEFDELQLGSGFVSRQFDYVNGEVTEEHKDNKMLKSTPTTQLVSEITFQDGRTIDYEYDAEERITKVVDSVDGVTEYSYDSLGQLLTETKNGEVISEMTYDNYGNIKSKNGIDYVYNGVWKDRLAFIGGQAIHYDAQGNPISYKGHTLVWEKGRQLKSFDNTTFTYNANGIRTSKTVDEIRHDFYLDGAKILREVWLDNILETVFDNEDSVCGIVYNSTPYYFMKNLQGDIIAITDKDGEVVARYSYDAWGKCEVEPSSKNAEIAHINPFRYRGYYFDRETNLYYLQSRYYDAEVGRFVNGDEVIYLGANYSLISYNLVTYCDNSPICFVDYWGNYVMYIYGGFQEPSAKRNIKLLKQKYIVYSYLVKSESDFRKVWNKKCTNRDGKLAKIDIVIINLHGNPKWVEYVNFKKLVKRKIDTLLLLVCNAGHLDYIDSNPATRFYLGNDIRQLVCCDGTHCRTHKQLNMLQPTSVNRNQSVKINSVIHSVVGDDIFKGWCIKPRPHQGFILYSKKSNKKITGFCSIGYKFLSIFTLLKKIGK